jgi:hypothetical protein
MATESDNYRIPLFEGTNLNKWKFKIETLLEELELLSFVEKSFISKVEFLEEDTDEQRERKEARLAELRRQGRKFKSQIIQRVADSHLDLEYK